MGDRIVEIVEEMSRLMEAIPPQISPADKPKGWTDEQLETWNTNRERIRQLNAELEQLSKKR